MGLDSSIGLRFKALRIVMLSDRMKHPESALHACGGQGVWGAGTLVRIGDVETAASSDGMRRKATIEIQSAVERAH